MKIKKNSKFFLTKYDNNIVNIEIIEKKLIVTKLNGETKD